MKKASLLVIILFIFPLLSQANDCPLGETSDNYPGKCNIYIDSNTDNICDHSELIPEDDYKNINIARASSQNIDSPQKRTYHLIPIFLGLTFLYILGIILVKKEKITLRNYRKLWNILLLITFLISGLLGVLLIIQINFGITISLPFNIIFWHVEMGVAMFAISLFHIIWHWPYYKNIFK